MSATIETQPDASAQAIANLLGTLYSLELSEQPPRLFMRTTTGWIIWPGAPEDWPERALALGAVGGPLAPAFIEAVRQGYDFIEHGDKLRVFKGR